MKSWIAPALMLVAVVGCSSDPGKAAERVDVSGTVTTPDKKPVGGVTLTLLPSSAGGAQTYAPVGADGKFTAKVIPGPYTFFFETASKTPAGIKAVPAKYHSANGDHKVTVVAGQPLEITVAP